MQCQACAFVNPAGMSYCGQCGTRLVGVCPACGNKNPPDLRFCGQCGKAVDEIRPRMPASNAEKEDAERRQLTVLFCDMVGSTALSEQLDPEELRELMRSYQAVCGQVVERFGGHVAQYLGDGLVVYFGFPQAHEEDAQRAVHAGLGIVDGVRALDESLDRGVSIRLAVRVGIHTGTVVAGEVGEGETRERLALGQTPTVAARLQSLAEPNTVVLSAATWGLVRGFFSCRSLGPQVIRGLSFPVEVFRVLSPSDLSSRFEAAVSRGLTPLVGREQELSVLLGAFDEARKGRGRALLLEGEGGIGKSRLLYMLQQRLEEDAPVWLKCQCSPFYENTALYPVIELLRKLFRFTSGDTPGEMIERLEASLESHGYPLPQVVPLFANLLSVPLSEGYEPSGLSAGRQRERTFEALLDLIVKMASEQVVCFLMEDLHWVDPSTSEFLDLLVTRAANTRLFVILTFRPVFKRRWARVPHLTRIVLEPLSPGQTAEMITKVAGDRTLPPQILKQLVENADGVPIFVEELTKTVLEMGLLRKGTQRYELVGPLPPLSIPSTLHDSLMARLDRLSTAKEVAQLASALGRRFSYEVIRSVSSLEAEDLERELERLVEAELLCQEGVPPQASFTFKHGLIREAAYDSLLKKTRQRHHRRIAQILEEEFLEVAAHEPELLAHHYTEAGASALGVPYWMKAGQIAARHSANLEAIGHYDRALELLHGEPESGDRDRQELALQDALGWALLAAKGYSAPEVQASFARAKDLCETIGDTPQLFRSLQGLWMYHVVRGLFREASKLAQRLHRIAEPGEDLQLKMRACFALGLTGFYLGEFPVARQQLEEGLALGTRSSETSFVFSVGDDIRVHILSFLALSLWHLGYPEEAELRSNEAVALARELGHPYGLAYALLNGAAWLHQLCGEPASVLEASREVVALAVEKDLPFFLAPAKVMMGWAQTFSDDAGSEAVGPGRTGIDLMSHSIEAYLDAGARMFQTFLLNLISVAHARVGRLEEGREAVEKGIAAVESTGERGWEAECHRIRGQLILAGEGPEPDEERLSEAAACFERALHVARRQQARSLELRAAMSLAVFWRNRGRLTEAQELLQSVYDGFSEGFDTADLRQARALLAEGSREGASEPAKVG